MKPVRWLILLCAVVWFAGLARLPAQSERILDFDSQIVVHTNGSMTVTETICVQASGNQIKRGIYRDFPQLYTDARGRRVKTRFEVVSVRRDGNSEPHRTEDRENGVRVYIGARSVLLRPGLYTYILAYKTDRQIGFFETHDELYWNATGNGWVFPIEHATATVILPDGTQPDKLEAYTGRQGTRDRNYTSQIVGGNARFETTGALKPQEGLTIVVSWPKGVVAPPPPAARMRPAAQPQRFSTPSSTPIERVRPAPSLTGMILAIAGLCLVLIYYLYIWSAVGKDPKSGTIIPLYGPPKGFTPAAVRYLNRMGYDGRAFTAAILNLAVKGELSIREYEKRKYMLMLNSSGEGKLLPEERPLLRMLFRDGSGRLLLDQVNYKLLQEARDDLKTRLATGLEKHYFVSNARYWVLGLLFSLAPLCFSLMDAGKQLPPGAIGPCLIMLGVWALFIMLLVSKGVGLWGRRSRIGAAAVLVLMVLFIAGGLYLLDVLLGAISVWVAALFAVGIFLNGMFYHLLKAPTLVGRKILDQIEGFKMYLSVAEKDRLNLENPPERTPALFEMFLPYALALDVEQKWSEQFAGVLAAASQGGTTYSPSFYSGSSWTTFNAATFAGSLGSSLSSAIASASTAPGSSSGFSGGGGGGGCSGGGGGGGGGGGW